MWKKSLAVALLVAGFGEMPTQQETALPVFRVTSERVVVEFIALDQKGRFVNDLGLKEIEVTVDGKKQEVDFLFPPGTAPQIVPLGQPGQKPGRKEDSADQPSPSSQAAPAASPSPDASPSQARTVILLDSRVMDASNYHHTVSAIRSFIDESLQANHLVMIAEIDRRLKIRAPFTRDKRALLAAVDVLQPTTVYNPLELARKNRLQNSATADLPIADATAKNEVTKYIDELQQQITSLRGGLRLLCYSLSAMPGRKHVVFFSEGYPMDPLLHLEFGSRNRSAFRSADERQSAAREVGRLKDPGVMSMVNDIVSLANSFGVTFYTVDARGLVGVPGLGADIQADTEAVAGRGHKDRFPGSRDEFMNLSTFKLTTINDLANTQNTLLALAAGTNGSAF
ncbi:MAG: VWA domain-containing protein, partial [Acidobacteriota bacterium]